MIVSILILGGCLGLLCAGFGCVESRTRITYEEWKYRENNKTSSRPTYGLDDWYRYL